MYNFLRISKGSVQYQKMTGFEIRQKFLDYFVQKGHGLVPSNSLVPENDPTTLFTGSGMQPMVPYLLGAPHPLGKKLVDSQKCFRAQDIGEVGDNRHTTFFEMLGNWSLGDYFKKEQLGYFFEFLTSIVGINPKKLYVTIFAGDSKLGIPKDISSENIWKELFFSKGIQAKTVQFITAQGASEVGMQGGRIFYYGSSKNWWSRAGEPENMPPGEPGGGDSEVFYEFDDVAHDSKFGKFCHPNCDCGRFLEIGNSVFMEYVKNANGSFSELPLKNVDFGGGLERIAAASINQPDIFKIDLSFPLIQTLEQELKFGYMENEQVTSTYRIIADHFKAAVFLIRDGVTPSNKQQGYVLRRLLRRCAVKLNLLKPGSMTFLPLLVDQVLIIYKDTQYFGENIQRRIYIKQVIEDEINKFKSTLDLGLKVLNKLQAVTSKEAFDLYQTYGFPIEVTEELLKDKGVRINKDEFEEEFRKHQDLSRSTSSGVFKGGLADASEKTTRLHTANHLLQASLRQILGDHIHQRGSNITAERLRFDFPHPEKLTDEQIKQVEDLVNQKIKQDLAVWFDIEDKDQAIKNGALTNYGENYPDKVKVYKIGIPNSSLFSMELCGGPHVEHTNLVGQFKIIKQESIGGGLRRIYATVT